MNTTAIQATLKALKIAYPNYKLIAVFEPACNTSASNYFETHAINAFEFADAVWLLPAKKHLYSDRFINNPIPLNEDHLCQQLQGIGQLTRKFSSYEELLKVLKTRNFTEKTVVCCFSNGGLSAELKTFSVSSS